MAMALGRTPVIQSRLLGIWFWQDQQMVPNSMVLMETWQGPPAMCRSARHFALEHWQYSGMANDNRWARQLAPLYTEPHSNGTNLVESMGQGTRVDMITSAAIA